MANFDSHEAQKQLSTLIARAIDGEEIVITIESEYRNNTIQE
jgi:antitoxin (DNA-binding transcriptional repressor) of toxin-antitoxin stability system